MTNNKCNYVAYCVLAHLRRIKYQYANVQYFFAMCKII